MANGCDNKEQGITVYKVVTLDKIVPVDSLSIDIINNYEEYKWGFIADYWKANFTKFVE